jgi:hypothetical protein
MRITRKTLQEIIRRLNKVLHRPEAAYTVDSAGRIQHANAGHFCLESNSPGDGWTRYTLAQMCPAGGVSTISPTLNASEFWSYMRGVFDVLDSEYTHNFDKGDAL